MSKVNLKTDFKDGDTLYDYELNNNFEIIQKGINEGNIIVWTDGSLKEVNYFRGTTEQIKEQPIKDGQILYDTETGETYLDTTDKRISTGSGNVVSIGDEEPTNEATKLWIPDNRVAPANVLRAEDIIDNLNSEDSKKPLSANQGKILNNNFKGTMLYDNPDGSNDSEMTLNENAPNYEYVEILAGNKQNESIGITSTKIFTTNNNNYANICVMGVGSTEIQVRLRIYSFNDNKMSLTHSRNVTLKSNTVELWTDSSIYIYKVIGYNKIGGSD